MGTGTVILTANNTYSGATSVNAGVLLLGGGTLNTAGTIAVAAGATFGGSGSAGSATIAAGGDCSGRIQ